ncbi:MAG TPA: hypothetical protein VFF65_13245 [Phycisphaerales bacterium]|nr:hypothetical protein [Phycisphaerales bacterium]
MNRNGLVQLAALGVVVAGLLLSTLLTVRIAGSMGRHQLVYTSRAEASMTREEALGIAAGAFRGMFVNFLWLRAQDLKQEGKYWEAVDLARTITRLQPRFPRVWAFHAWNLSYNISVTTQTPEERWQWVQSGIRLLRDEGIPANPNDMLLHKELAWIFLHKVQMRMDDANNKYKEWFAREWTIATGPPPDTVMTSPDRNANIEACAVRLQNIIDAPDSMEDMAEKAPEAYALVQRLKAELGIDVTTEKGRLELLTAREEFRSAQRRAELFQRTVAAGQMSPKLLEMLNDPALWENAWNPLLGHLRKRTIVDTYRMEPDRMLRYTRKYGPLDWRHPASHAVYWAARGVEQGLNRVQTQNRSDFDFINTDRMVLHAVQELYRTGLVQYDILLPEYFAQFPSVDFIDSYDSIIDELIARENEQMAETKGVKMEDRAFRFYSEGYENFLGDAIVMLFRRQQLDRAKAFQMKMANFKGRNRNDIGRERIRNLPLADYVVEVLHDRTSTPNVALQEVYSSLQAAYVFGLLAGNEEVFNKNYEYAARFHKAYYDEQFRKTNVDRDKPRMGVIDVDFPTVAGQVLFQTTRLLGPDSGSLIYRRAPEPARLVAYAMYDDLIPRDEQGRRVQTRLDDVFPPPNGYESWRAQKMAEQNRRDAIRGSNQLK